MSEEIKKVMEDLKASTEKYGLYLRGAFFAASNTDEDAEALNELPDSDDLKKKLANGQLGLILSTVFSTNNLAFSQRIIEPEVVAAEDEFNIVVPSEFEMLKEKMQQRLKEGKNPFSDD